MPLPDDNRLGSKIRALRRQQQMTQTDLAARLGISASYLNLIEHNRRGMTADLLVRAAGILPIDYRALSPERDERTTAALLEVFGDPLFEGLDLLASDVRDCAASYGAVGEAIVRLYQ